MTSQLVFQGHALAHPKVHVTVTDTNGERALQPPADSEFDWGHMGATVGNLAAAIAAELFPEEERQISASLIKRHFLTQIKRRTSWQLTGAEIQAYVAERRPSMTTSAIAGARA